MKQYRQGDVLLISTDKAPEGKPVKAENGLVILARGEATGHHHSVPETMCTLFGNDVLVVNEPTQISHQEHGAIEIAPGNYWVVRQRMYQRKKIVRVQD